MIVAGRKLKPLQPRIQPGWASRGLLLACPFIGQAGRTADYSGAGRHGTLTGGLVAAGTRGPVRRHTTGTDTIDFGSAAFLPASNCTWVLVYRKTDATLRGANALGTSSGATGAGVFLPYLDGTVYWDWAGNAEGSTRVSVGGLTFGDDVWVFTTGPRGMEIWQNGIRRASNSATPTRTSTTASFGTGFYSSLGSDLADYGGILIYDRQAAIGEIIALSIDPWLPFRAAPTAWRGGALAPAGGTTAVGQQKQALWDVRAAVGQQRQGLWDLRAVVGQARSLPWDVRSTAGQQRQAAWDARAAVGLSRSVPWDVRAAVGQQGQILWDVAAALAAVGAQAQILWDVLQAAGRQRQVLWDLRSAVGVSRVAVWDVRATAGQSRQTLWDIASALLAVGSERGLIWDVRATAGHSGQLVWDARAATGQSRQCLWDIRRAVVRDRSLLWDVRTAVGLSRLGLWDVRALAGASKVLRWDTSSLIVITPPPTYLVAVVRAPEAGVNVDASRTVVRYL